MLTLALDFTLKTLSRSLRMPIILPAVHAELHRHTKHMKTEHIDKTDPHRYIKFAFFPILLPETGFIAIKISSMHPMNRTMITDILQMKISVPPLDFFQHPYKRKKDT